jgi:hypothetical protein
MRLRIACAALAGLGLLAAASAHGQCPTAVACTQYLGKGSKGSHFRILVPEPWDGDVFLVNHGFELNPLTIAPHGTCQGAPSVACASNGDCAGVPGANGTCNRISLLGYENIVLAEGKAVGASTYSQTGWSVFASAKDLQDMVKFLKKKHPGKLRRVIVTGFSMGGAVTVDATMRLKPGKFIHGAIPMCSCSGGGNPSWDAATDLRLVYDYLCQGVQGAEFTSLPDVGEPDLAQIDMALRVNACMGVISPDPDTDRAAAQAERKARFRELTRFPGTDFEIVITMGYVTLGMGDMVDDPARLKGKRHGWNEGLDYAVLGGSAAGAFDAAAVRFGPGPGRRKLRKNTFVDFTKGPGKKVDYPILAYAGRSDYVCIPEFQKLYADAAAMGGKDHVQVWGSMPSHCIFTAREIEAVVREYLDWLDSYDSPAPDVPTPDSVLARCLALPGATAADCNFDTALADPPPLNRRVPARADWPAAARSPLP